LPRHGSLEIWDISELGRCVTAWKGVTGLPKGQYSREGKVREWIFVGH